MVASGWFEGEIVVWMARVKGKTSRRGGDP